MRSPFVRSIQRPIRIHIKCTTHYFPSQDNGCWLFLFSVCSRYHRGHFKTRWISQQQPCVLDRLWRLRYKEGADQIVNIELVPLESYSCIPSQGRWEKDIRWNVDRKNAKHFSERRTTSPPALRIIRMDRAPIRGWNPPFAGFHLNS